MDSPPSTNSQHSVTSSQADPPPSGRPILRLDPALVNQIAAGEVIERPASVVKELLENAIDAGATRIDVAIEEGGVQLIRVTDNGCGIGRDDLALAVAPHATSKIRSTEDLFNIRTLGFRGEALASIASISRFRIVSRPAGQNEAFEYVGHGERVANESDESNNAPHIRPSAGPVGTTVEVRNLFYNVPARRKFLRQAATEMGHVTEQIARLALAHPAIAFSVSHNGRPARSLPAVSDRRSRIGDFYGPELASCLIPVQRSERDLEIEALFAPPAQSRASSKWQYVFLNGRFITDRRIAYAVREAFRGLMEHDRHAVVFLFLRADPRQFDVNVHPTKLEVRWRDAGLVQSQVLAVLREALLARDLTPAFSLNRAIGDAGATRDAGADDRQRSVRQAVADYLRSIDPTQARIDFAPPPSYALRNVRPSLAPTFATPTPPSDNQYAPPDPVARPTDPRRPPADVPPLERGATHSANESTAAQTAPNSLDSPAGSVIQVHNAYIVAQTDEGIVIIDQHALHERILYEKFRQRLLAGPLESQRLLIPPTVCVSAAQAEAAERQGELLQRLGIELDRFGPASLAIQSFPILLSNLDPAAFVRDLLDKLVDCGEATAETLVHAALDMMACKAAIKAGDALTQDEMVALLSQRDLTERSSNCPHGRPTTLQLTTRDLERQFKRT
ncbi:MAG: DNA mismatch repair protein MutL [Phycisphaerae bacterium]|nr:MAG: DNA mismatch repair endonuclease MutL [Planctomycetia bacterium]GJQ26095.1 MAG: DNA mismatch repair protein MutL [Phycisphaerae bacterium]